jgi:hypothetical protein
MLTELIILGMGSYPANKEMNLVLSKGIFADHPIVITANIKYNTVGAITQQISGPKCLFNCLGRLPIGKLDDGEPNLKRTFTASILFGVSLNGFLSN